MYRLRYFTLLSVMLLLTACQQEGHIADLKEYVKTTYENEQPEIDPLPAIEPYQPFNYIAAADSDPFSKKNIASLDKKSAVKGTGPDLNRRREVLESYPLDALKLVGTISIADTPWVIVQTNEGVAHRASIGNYLGQNDGRITKIIPDEQKIVLSELVLDARNRWVNREVEFVVGE